MEGRYVPVRIGDGVHIPKIFTIFDTKTKGYVVNYVEESNGYDEPILYVFDTEEDAQAYINTNLEEICLKTVVCCRA